MRPVNRDAAHLQALSLPRKDLQAATQAEGTGQRAEPAPFPVFVPDAGRDKRCRRLTFCHPNLPQIPPPPFSTTRGSQKAVARG